MHNIGGSRTTIAEDVGQQPNIPTSQRACVTVRTGIIAARL